MVGIYCITNNITGLSYVGQSNDIERRIQEHFSPSRYKASYSLIDKIIKKYGKNNFSWYVLEQCSVDELNEKEIYWIEQKNSFLNGYNCTLGGNDCTKGEKNPKAKLTIADVTSIRKSYANRENKKETYERYKDKISFAGFESCWYGKSWNNVMPEVFTDENKKYYIKSANSSNFTYSDDGVISFRKRYISEIALDIYNSTDKKVNYSTFQQILCGIHYRHLPVYDKKHKVWVDKNIKNDKNTVKKKAKNSVFSDEEVMSIRKSYVSNTAKELYEQYKRKISFDSFRKMLSGKTYSYLPYYSKNQSKWFYPEPVSTIPKV